MALVDLNDRKEDFSFSYVWAIAASAGVVFEPARVDRNSVDARLRALDSTHTSAPQIEVQMKCTSTPDRDDAHLKFPLPVKNYNDLRARVIVPRVLIVVVVPSQNVDWIRFDGEHSSTLQHCAYWHSLRGLPSTDNSSTVTVSIPRHSIFDRNALLEMINRANSRRQL